MKTKTGPIKRHEVLKPLSREHHHGLLLCWKIRQGLRKNIPLKRISDYAFYFFSEFLSLHFVEEETKIFPLLGENDLLIKRALDEHTQLRKMFEKKNKNEADLRKLAQLLESHIRYEERGLFQEIQERVPDQLELLDQVENGTVIKDEEWPDQFWNS